MVRSLLTLPNARAYRPDIGRFMQTDPIGCAAGPNLYAYVGNDPVNLTDPLGLDPPNVDGGIAACRADPHCDVVTGRRLPPARIGGGGILRSGGGFGGFGGGGGSRHRYVVSLRVTEANTQCTISQAADSLQDNMVPGRSGDNVSGQTYDASAGQTFSSPDTIRFEQIGATVFQNVTTSDHIFRGGSVRGEILGNQRTGFTAIFVGGGVNSNIFVSWINEASGKTTFDRQAQTIRRDLRERCGR